MQSLHLPAWLPSPSEHLLVTSLALLTYVIHARARRERRAPAAAIAWVLGLALLPYLMLPLYLVFGHRKLSAAPAAPPAPTPPAPHHWADALLQSLQLAPAGPAQVHLHADGRAAREALWQLFDSAQTSLDICTFLIASDTLGREALERLARCAARGVRVRLLYDGLSAWQAPRAPLQALRAAGAEVRVFRPLLSWRRAGPRNLRNHRKLCIADGALLWAGGRNLADEYFTGTTTQPPWLDLSFDLRGAAVQAAARQFDCDWQAAHDARATLRTTPPPQSLPVAGSDGNAQFLPSGPDQFEDTAQLLLIDACFRARQRILAVTPYFVPDAALLGALRLALRRGVQVMLVIPARSNHHLADFVRNRPLRELTEAGAQVRLLPVMSHAKAVVIDDSVALCGSINLDCRSLLLNYESAVVFYGHQHIAWLADWILARSAESRPFDARRPGVLRDLAEGALLAVAFQV